MEMANKLTENQIELSNGRVYCIVPIKVKYMLLNFYNKYLSIKGNGIVKLLGFTDTEDNVRTFLSASLDSEELAGEFFNNMLAPDMEKLLEITKRINNLIDEPEIKND